MEQNLLLFLLLLVDAGLLMRLCPELQDNITQKGCLSYKNGDMKLYEGNTYYMKLY